MSGGPTTAEFFTLTVTGLLPNGDTTTWTFDIWITPCAAPNALILQPFTDQKYWIEKPLFEYDAPAMSASVVDNCPQTITYTNSVVTAAWITGFTDYAGIGKVVGW